MVKEIESAEELDALLKVDSDTPVVVDVFAHWCRPCTNLAPILDQVSQELDGRATIVKVDLEKFGEFAEAQDVQSLPTLLSFEKGVRSGVMVGLQPKQTILDFIGV